MDKKQNERGNKKTRKNINKANIGPLRTGDVDMDHQMQFIMNNFDNDFVSVFVNNKTSSLKNSTRPRKQNQNENDNQNYKHKRKYDQQQRKHRHKDRTTRRSEHKQEQIDSIV